MWYHSWGQVTLVQGSLGVDRRPYGDLEPESGFRVGSVESPSNSKCEGEPMSSRRYRRNHLEQFLSGLIPRESRCPKAASLQALPP